mgnify:CR=1 FL=1
MGNWPNHGCRHGSSKYANIIGMTNQNLSLKDCLLATTKNFCVRNNYNGNNFDILSPQSSLKNNFGLDSLDSLDIAELCMEIEADFDLANNSINCEDITNIDTIEKFAENLSKKQPESSLVASWKAKQAVSLA